MEAGSGSLLLVPVGAHETADDDIVNEPLITMRFLPPTESISVDGEASTPGRSANSLPHDRNVTVGGWVDVPTAIDVLLVEDDPADAFMVEEALGGWHVATKLHVASDGEQAAAFLRRLDPYTDAPRPAFVLLDLNMPRKNGFEFLDDIKRDEHLSVIPVVVFTSSSDPEHVLRSYASHANAYVVKPTDFADYERTVRSIEHFYTQVSVRPPAPEDRAGNGGNGA